MVQEDVKLQLCLLDTQTRMKALLELVGGPQTKGKFVCRGCGAQVYWIRHANGKLVPYTQFGLNHFVDCPNREDFRKAKT